MSGTGKALINMVLQSVGPNMEIGVLVSQSNVPALALYKSVGFQPVSRKGEYAGHGEHLSLVLRTP